VTEAADDLELLRRVERGDVEAFERIFARHHAALCIFVDRFLSSPAVAEEVVQDLFFELWMQRGRWVVSHSLRSYLYAAARNRALKRIRHESVARRWLSEEVQEDVPFSMGTPALSADAALEADETRIALADAIARLPERSRMAVALRWQEKLSYAEVAESMGISVKGVEKLVSIALKHLRRALGEPDR
jgi:RNA polymerase sigma-70 factor, ECF subfamily